MNRNRIAHWFLLFSLFASQYARAEFFLEPNVGYTTGLLGQSDNPAFEIKAPIFGGRVGYRFVDLALGFDYSMGIGTATQLGNQGDFKPTDIGVFLRYELPLKFHVYGSLFVISKAKIHPTVNTADFSGQSFRFGLGWAGIPYCMLIFETTSRIYSRYAGASLSKSVLGTTFGGSLSFPLPSLERER